VVDAFSPEAAGLVVHGDVTHHPLNDAALRLRQAGITYLRASDDKPSKRLIEPTGQAAGSSQRLVSSCAALCRVHNWSAS
jgi:hypothetical protein